ncbi:MAG: prepilin-type N-terminal cleavage/methylation domain-containing protein [Lachnospiraceae bacterium]|nr:prepilin-type N-terminal cleavage/methylation domain-containing protein [Lachnospiraceae bacterium]
MRKIIRDNKGFSLVELLIALTIGAILVAGIGSIMIVSSRSFSSTSAEAGLQSSAQIVMDHIQDVVVDANKKIVYSYTTAATPTDADWVTIIKDSDITVPDADVTQKKLSVYTYNLNQISSPDAYNEEEDMHYDIVWEHDLSDDEKSTIRFDQQELIYNGSDIVDSGSVESEKLADNVSSFKCDLTDMEKKRIIYVEMDFSKSKGRYQYHVANNVSLRNKVALSTDSITVSSDVTLDTLNLTAEPGMDLPLTIRRIITRGNASNIVNYELDGGDGGRTSAATDLANPTTLHIDEKERAETIKMNAVDSMGGRHPFEVYINRVKWTNNNATDLGETGDDVEGIQITGKPEHDEINAGSSGSITVQLNSNPGAPGIDRTRPEMVSANIISITPAAAATIRLEPSGPLHWTITVPGSVHKDTKIKIRFTALHSLADGGIATRTIPYPGSNGVYKDLELTVTEAGVMVHKSPFLRGIIGPILYPEYLKQFYNEAGLSEWEEYEALPNKQRNYLAIKTYATRPAIDGDYKNKYYPDDLTDWNTVNPGALEEKYDTRAEYESHGWQILPPVDDSGNTGNFNGFEFKDYDPNKDMRVVFAIIVKYDGGWWSSTPAETLMYGFRERISDEKETPKYNEKYDLGPFYKLDAKNDNVDSNLLIQKLSGQNKKWIVWQEQVCFADISSGGNDGGLSKSVCIAEGGFDDAMILKTESGRGKAHGSEQYANGMLVYMGFELPLSEARNKIVFDKSNVIGKIFNPDKVYLYDNFTGSEKEYNIWPRFSYNNRTFDRRSGYLGFKLRHGNITLQSTKESNDKREGFVPYPEYTTDNGVTIEAHPDFFGVNLDDVYKSVGVHTIRQYKNPNSYSGDPVNKDYACYMKIVDGVYYLRIPNQADYKFDTSKERWVFVKSNNFKGNLISGLNGNSKDVYLPGAGDEEFFTGFKDISKQANSSKKWADKMAIYQTSNGLVQYSKYQIAYYRQDGKYCVDIYTLGEENSGVYKKYSYNEQTEQWDSKGDLFTVNITTPRGDKFYIPTKNDLEWYGYPANSDFEVAKNFARYRYVQNHWEKYGNGANDFPTQRYKYNAQTNDLRIRFHYNGGPDVDYQYNFTKDTWVKK